MKVLATIKYLSYAPYMLKKASWFRGGGDAINSQ